MSELSLEFLAAQLEKQQETIGQLQTKLGVQSETISNLKIQLAAKQTELKVEDKRKFVTPKEPVKIGKDSYRFTVPKFHIAGTTYVSEDVTDDVELIKKILAVTGQGILKKLE